MMRIPARLAALPLLALLGLAVAACAAGSTSPPAASATASSVAASASAAGSAPGSPSSAASASGAAAASTATSAASGGNAVTIQGFAFGPAALTVAVGTTVTWTNKDPVEHTVTADDGSFGSQPLPTGQTFQQTFSKPGTFSYHCKIHPTMTATITVH